MKYTLVFFVTILVSSVYSQEIIFPMNDNGEIEFEEIVETNNTKDQLYSNAKEWIAKTYGDYKSVIQFEDENSRKLIMKGISNVSSKGNGAKEDLSYTITIECKDNKYRYRIDNIEYKEDIPFAGMTVHGAYISPLQRLVWIKEKEMEILKLKQEIDSLNNIETSNMKKKELSMLQKKISSKKSIISNLEGSRDLMISNSKNDLKAINGIISSLKYAMYQNNDF